MRSIAAEALIFYNDQRRPLDTSVKVREDRLKDLIVHILSISPFIAANTTRDVQTT